MKTIAETTGILIEAWKSMVGRLPNGEVEQAQGVATCLGHVPLAFFNLSVPDRPIADAEDLRRVFSIAAERAGRCEHPAMCAIREDWAPQDWESVASEFRLVRALNITGMILEELKPPRRELPPLEFRRVSNDAMARELAMLNAQGYGMPMELFECISNIDFWPADRLAFVGYADGKAVTAAAALPVSGTVYVALVATLNEEQGKGYGEAVVRHAIAEGQKAMGSNCSTLHASDMGLPVYRAMGFEPSSRFALLMEAPQ